MRIIIILFCSISLFNSCCTHDGCIKIKNNANHAIYFDVCYSLPNKEIPSTSPTSNVQKYKCNANDYKSFGTYSWSQLINNLPSKKIRLFIFHADTVETVDWEKIRKEYKVLKWYDLSVEDLEKMDWTVEYP